MTWVGQRVVRDIRNELFRHVLGQSAAFFSADTTGRLMSRITNDVEQVQRVVSETARRSRCASRSRSSASARALLLRSTRARDRVPHRRAVIVYPLVRLGQRVRRTTRRSQEALEQISHVTAEAFTGHRIVKAFGAEAARGAKFERASHQLLPHQHEGHERACRRCRR